MSVARVDAPMTLAAGARADVTITLRNRGSLVWPTGTALVTSAPAGRASVLTDASWPAADRPAVIAGEVAPDDIATVTFPIVAPGTAPLEVSESFALDAGGTRFGALALVVTIVAGDPSASSEGGCDAGRAGSSGALALALAVVPVIARRRRR